jgi:alpha-glucosidase
MDRAAVHPEGFGGCFVFDARHQSAAHGTHSVITRGLPMKNLLSCSLRLALITLAMTVGTSRAFAKDRVLSPSGELRVTFDLSNDGAPVLAIDYLGKTLLLPSKLSLAPEFLSGFTQTAATTASHDSSWENPIGERRRVPNRYRELSVELRHRSGEIVLLAIRAYNEGAAFWATRPGASTPQFAVSTDRTELLFPPATQTWVPSSGNGGETRQPASTLSTTTPLPLALEFADGRLAALSTLPETRWRVILVGRTAAELVERNYLRSNLAPATSLTYTTWIKPGRVLRGFPPTKVGAEAAADYAASAGLGYISLAHGWRENGLDVAAIVGYARARALGVLLQVDRSLLEKGADTTLRQFAQWGVKGVEIARGDAPSERGAAWLVSFAKLAAEHHLLLAVPHHRDLAELSRPWPHVFTVGNPPATGLSDSATWNCTLPFTSGLFATLPSTELRTAGVTRAHRLALSMITADPFASIAWADRPLADVRNQAMEFFRRVPAAPTETKVLAAEIGRHGAIARRTGEDWYIGAITGADARTLSLPLTMLDPDREYIAHIYTDYSAAPSNPTEAYAYRRVYSKDTVDLKLLPSGGAALWITPALKRR